MKTNTLKLLLLAAALLLAGFLAQAQDKKISQLPALPSVAGNEAIPLAISGTNYYATPNQLKTWLNIVAYVPLAGTNKITAPLTYSTNVASLFTKYSLVDSNWAATHFVPLGSSAYLSSTLTNGKIYVGNSSNVGTVVTPSLNSAAGTFTMSNTGQFTFPDATTSVRGFLNNTDWNSFNNKQTALSGTGFVYQSGSVTSYTTSIPNASLANSSISGVSLGSNLFNHSTAYGLSGSNYNGSSSQTWKVDTSTIVSKLYLFANASGFIKALTTTGTSGAASVTTGTLNIPRYDNATTLNSLTTATVLSSAGTFTSATWQATPIANAYLANSTFTVNGTAMALGTSSTITSAAGTLTGTTLNASVVTSSLTSVGNLTAGTASISIYPVVGTVTTASVITINTDNYTMYTVTSLSTATTFTTPTGTPKAGQSLIIRIKDNGTARALSFSTGTNGFRFSGDAPAPSTTTISKTMYLGFRWNEADSKWDNVSPYIDNF
ncbi:MAG TPA: hypothetical protein VK835_09985 [Bacteroidia bacterium]|jgi:hypothetical protein|nr:hypothetical protein [Bacteroidia bacterium]